VRWALHKIKAGKESLHGNDYRRSHATEYALETFAAPNWQAMSQPYRLGAAIHSKGDIQWLKKTFHRKIDNSPMPQPAAALAAPCLPLSLQNCSRGLVVAWHL
jgi:hypothetical protein